MELTKDSIDDKLRGPIYPIIWPRFRFWQYMKHHKVLSPSTSCAERRASSMAETLNPNADIVATPHVGAGIVDLSVPRKELGKRDTICLLQVEARIARSYQVEFLAAANDAGHLRRGASRGRLGVTGRRGRRTFNVDAHVVVEPEVSALCSKCVRTDTSSIGGIHTSVDLRVP